MTMRTPNGLVKESKGKWALKKHKILMEYLN